MAMAVVFIFHNDGDVTVAQTDQIARLHMIRHKSLPEFSPELAGQILEKARADVQGAIRAKRAKRRKT